MSQAHCVFRRQPCGVGSRMDLAQCLLARSVALGWCVPYVVNLYSLRTSAVTCHWRGRVWNAGVGSEGTRPALLPAGPVPERPNVKHAPNRKPPAFQWLGPPPCSPFFVRGPIWRGVSLASVSGGTRKSNGWENRQSFQAATLEYVCCGRKLGGPWGQSQ